MSQIKETKKQVGQLIDLMKTNVTKVIERDEKMTDLSARSAAMEANASQFQMQSRSLKKKYWFKNKKWTVIIVLISLCVVGLIVGLSAGLSKKSD